MIDITMTSVIRPHILKRTLESFCYNMFTSENIKKYNCRLIINIDPIGEKYTQEYVANIAKQYFKDIIIFKPDTPSFANAVIRCWKHITNKLCFHLEDDWVLLSKIDLNKMIDTLDMNDMVSMRLNKESLNEEIKNINFIYYKQLSLNPTLFKSNFLQEIVEYMDPNLNPEKQLRLNAPGKRGELLTNTKQGIYTGSGYNKIVQDIGRDWMKNTKFYKEIGFREWRKNEN